MMREIEIIHAPEKNEPYIVVKKISGLPSAPLSENDTFNAFSKAAEIFPECLNVSGKKAIEHGLLHRLDTETSGLLLIAAEQEFYDFIQNEQKEDRFVKTYKAFCDIEPESPEKLGGFPLLDIPRDFFSFREEKISGNKNACVRVSSFFRNYGKGFKEVRPVTENSGKAALKKSGKKLYSTDVYVKSAEAEGKNISVECKITQGYRHQVRSHLSWLGLPVQNDRIYNPNNREFEEKFAVEKESDFGSPCENENMKFFAAGLEFFNPYLGKNVFYEI